MARHIDPTTGRVSDASGRPLGHLDAGGYVRVGRHLAHRLVWEQVHGPIPAGGEINHLSGDKQDNRIGNLELTDRSGQMAHATATGLIDHRGAKNGAAKLRDSDVLRIRELRQQGMTQRAIGALFGVGQPCVSQVLSGARWSHVEGTVA